MMSKLRTLLQIVLADLRERTRRYSFLMVILANLFLAYQVYIGNFTPRLGLYRGANNTAWVGASITCTVTIMLIIFGFYMIKNSINRDIETGVGQILAGTALSKFIYVIGKVLSNFVVLAIVLLIITIAAVLMVLVNGWEGSFDIWQLTAPFLIVCLPPLFVISAFAVLFESVRFLRGGYGNVIYFIAILCVLPVGIDPIHPIFDFMGFGLFIESMEQVLLTQYPGASVPFNLNPEYIADLKIFVWNGIDWSFAIIWPKFVLIGTGILMALLASIVFDRFDLSPKRQKVVLSRRRSRSASSDHQSVQSHVGLDTTSIMAGSLTFSLFPIVLEEFKLLVKGQHKIWYVLVAGLVIAQLFAPLDVVRSYILPVSWAMPILIWSAMGVRDRLYGCQQLMLSVPYPERRILASNWIAGIMVSLLAGSGALLHSLFAGDWRYFIALIIGAVFIPTLAISSGLLSRSSRLFETVYAVIWYVGALNHMPALDFAGAVPAGFESGIPFYYLAASIALIVLTASLSKFRVNSA